MARIVVSHATSVGELFRAFCVLYDASESSAEIAMLSHIWRAVGALPWRDLDLSIAAQAAVGQYRADFLLEGPGGALAIEVDGRQHRQTAEVIAYDLARDRDFAARRVRVLRFTVEQVLDAPTATAAVAAAIASLTSPIEGAA